MTNHLYHKSFAVQREIPTGIDWDLRMPTPADERGLRTLTRVMESLENRKGEGLRMEFHYAPGLMLEVWKRDEEYVTKVKLRDDAPACRYLLHEDIGELCEKMRATVAGENAVGRDEHLTEKGFGWTVSVPAVLTEERFEPVEAVICSLREAKCEYLVMDLQHPVGEATFIQTAVTGGRYRVEIRLEGKHRMKQYRRSFSSAKEVAGIFRTLACGHQLPT